MKRAFLALLLTTLSCFAGGDFSIEARMDGWSFDIDTVGLPPNGDPAVTRVLISRPGHANEASLELPGVASGILWEHLAKLPKQRKKFEAFKAPKSNYVALVSDHYELITDERAFALLRLWLDSHRAEWRAPESPELQAALRAGFFPPKQPKTK
jgi:hypothetical protein